jgi:diguanylate cyclase (GGDEF)-like protein
VAVGGLINLALGLGLQRWERLPSWFGYATALLDVALISGAVLALDGPSNRYAHLYLLSVATAAMRFGFWGTMVTTLIAWSALALVFRLTYGVPDDLPYQVFYPTLLLMLAGLLLGRFAQQVKVWLTEGMRREGRLEQRLTELAVIQQVNRAVYDLKSGDTLQNIVEVCTAGLDFRRSALFLSQKQEGMPDRYFSFRRQEVERWQEELPPLYFDRHLFEAMLQVDRPFVVDGSQGSEMMAQGPLLEIAVPLRTSAGSIGVLVVDCGDRKSVSETDMEVLSALASSATLAIENAQIHNVVQWRAEHDGLTNLYNHGYFQEALRREIEVNGAEKNPVTLLMIELDSFKRYNDTYGHRQGDMALISVARALEVCVEPWQGTVARYGGDEFVAILPRLNRLDALEVADEVRIGVRGLTLAELSRHTLPGITVSVGVAVYPDDAQSAGQLIDAADRAMYVAKRRGGNQVEDFSQLGDLSSFPLFVSKEG